MIVNFRSSALVDACVDSLLAGTRRPEEIVVIDNEAMHDAAPPARLGTVRHRFIARSANPGYATTCNDGAREASGDIVLFLNADVTVSAECLERCMDVLEADPGIGVVGCRLVRLDGSLDHACHRGIPTPGASLAYKLRLGRLFPRSQRANRYLMSWLDTTTEHDIEACSGAFMLMPRAVLDEVGGWDERYRFYAEDLDLCLRVSQAGRQIRYIGTVTATHIKGAFSHHNDRDRDLDPEQWTVKHRVSREIARSHRLFYEEHMRSSSALPVRAAVELLFGFQDLQLNATERLTRP